MISQLIDRRRHDTIHRPGGWTHTRRCVCGAVWPCRLADPYATQVLDIPTADERRYDRIQLRIAVAALVLGVVAVVVVIWEATIR